ncbi:unknown [Bacteroides sp. CAG:633]|nr:unknown [Bacteroides sp. CAG:633]
MMILAKVTNKFKETKVEYEMFITSFIMRKSLQLRQD